MNRRLKGLSLASKLLVAVVVMATTGLLSVQASSRVLAKCYPSRTADNNYYFDGWYAPNYLPGGIYSSILTYQPDVVSSTKYGKDSTGTGAWVMLENPNWDGSGSWGSGGGSNYMNWAQIGWWATDSTHVYEFAQFTTQPDAPNTAAHVGQWLNTAPGTMIQGSRHQYMVLENNTSGYFTFFVDGTLAFAAVGSGAFSYFPADDAEAAAEIHTLASQMAGGNSYPDDFSGTWWWLPGPSNWETYYTGTYSSATLSPGQYSAFNHGIIASTEAQISDSACPS